MERWSDRAVLDCRGTAADHCMGIFDGSGELCCCGTFVVVVAGCTARSRKVVGWRMMKGSGDGERE
jgi:hypothetical protein